MRTIAIVGLLLSTVRAESRKEVRVDADLENLSAQVRIFKAQQGRLPTAKEGLEILVENKTEIPNWRPLLSAEPLDPWGEPYQYVLHPKSAVTTPRTQEDDMEFGLFSFGPDRTSATAGNDADDINTWDPYKESSNKSEGWTWNFIGWVTALSCAWAGLLWRVGRLIPRRGAGRPQAFTTRR